MWLCSTQMAALHTCPQHKADVYFTNLFYLYSELKAKILQDLPSLQKFSKLRLSLNKLSLNLKASLLLNPRIKSQSTSQHNVDAHHCIAADVKTLPITGITNFSYKEKDHQHPSLWSYLFTHLLETGVESQIAQLQLLSNSVALPCRCKFSVCYGI